MDCGKEKMKINQLENMVKGWLVGDFDPSMLKTKDFEVAIKRYKAGDGEPRHVHRVATEITVIVSGRVEMNRQSFFEGDIIKLEPGESTDFKVIEDTITVVIKAPCVAGDKYLT